MEHAMTSSVERETASIHSIARYRNSHTIMISFKVPSYIGQEKIHLLYLLALLPAKTRMNEYTAMVSCRFFLIMRESRR
jgi:hypothetical protein